MKASYHIEIITSSSMRLSNQLFEIQKNIWGMSDRDALPAWRMFTVPKTSGLLIVAIRKKSA